MKRPFELVAEIQEKDAEIERLKDEYESLMGRFRCYVYESKQLITELADALEEEFGESRDLMQSQQRPWNLIERAREATR